MKRTQQSLGLDGEGLAAGYLETKGYRILERRYRTRFGELDLVARLDELVVFIEVKTRTGLRFGRPVEAVDRRKRSRLARVARHYLANHPDCRALACRFDVVGITMEPGSEPTVDHIEDAFRL